MQDITKRESRHEYVSNTNRSILGDVRRITPKRGGDGPDGYEIEYNDGTRIALVFEKPLR